MRSVRVVGHFAAGRFARDPYEILERMATDRRLSADLNRYQPVEAPVSAVTATLGKIVIHRNMTMREALRAAEQLGCIIDQGKGADACCWHPSLTRRVRFNASRKDAHGELANFLRMLANRQNAPEAPEPEEQPAAPAPTPEPVAATPEPEPAPILAPQPPEAPMTHTVDLNDLVTYADACRILGIKVKQSRKVFMDTTGCKPVGKVGKAYMFSRKALEADRAEIEAYIQKRKAEFDATRRAAMVKVAAIGRATQAARNAAPKAAREDVNMAALSRSFEAAQTVTLEALAAIEKRLAAIEKRLAK